MPKALCVYLSILTWHIFHDQKSLNFLDPIRVCFNGVFHRVFILESLILVVLDNGVCVK